MVKVVYKTTELLDIREKLNNESVGLVPTMGNLHKGHLSLVEKSLQENNISIVTIFVNPKQFGPNEDLDEYPRTLEADVKILEELHKSYPKKKLYVFAPKDEKEIYPNGFSTRVEVDNLTNKLCGSSRPGHFAGVTTVVYQLFAITKPHNAYFGQKDYQQFKVIERMTNDLRLNISIILMPIIREIDGLALSSRNQYLAEDERINAIYLNKTLKKIEHSLSLNGPEVAKNEIKERINESPAGTKWDYLEILDADYLSDTTSQTSHFIIAGALFVNKTRLIDNLRIKS